MIYELNFNERVYVAEALLTYAQGVQENLDAGEMDMRDHDAEMDGERNEEGYWPVVEDYQADAERIRLGEDPLHDLTREVLEGETDVAALMDDPTAFRELVARLYKPRPLGPLETLADVAMDVDAGTPELLEALMPFLTAKQHFDLAAMMELCPLHLCDAQICLDDELKCEGGNV